MNDLFLVNHPWSSPATWGLLLGVIGIAASLFTDQPTSATEWTRILVVAGVLAFLVSKGRAQEAWLILLASLIVPVIIGAYWAVTARHDKAKLEQYSKIVEAIYGMVLIGAVLLVATGYW